MYESEKRKLHRRHKKGARNPNLQVVIKHAWHVCSQHSVILVTRARRFLVTWSWNEPSGSGDENGTRLDFHQEWMECTKRNLITRVKEGSLGGKYLFSQVS